MCQTLVKIEQYFLEFLNFFFLNCKALHQHLNMTEMIWSGCKHHLINQSLVKVKAIFSSVFANSIFLHQIEPMSSLTWEDGSPCCVAMDTGPLCTASYSATEHTVCFPSCIRATLPEDNRILDHW